MTAVRALVVTSSAASFPEQLGHFQARRLSDEDVLRTRRFRGATFVPDGGVISADASAHSGKPIGAYWHISGTTTNRFRLCPVRPFRVNNIHGVSSAGSPRTITTFDESAPSSSSTGLSMPRADLLRKSDRRSVCLSHPEIWYDCSRIADSPECHLCSLVDVDYARCCNQGDRTSKRTGPPASSAALPQDHRQAR